MRSSARSAPARGRRTPVSAAKSGLNLPWIPIGIVAGVAIVLAVAVYLVLQANKTPASDLARWAAIEKSIATDPNLPGEGVDLETIYNGTYGSTTGNNTGQHVTHNMDYASEQGLPPAGGPHWGSGTCGEHVADSGPFCGPVQWGIYRPPDYWPAESLAHAEEHGGVVIWYNTTNQQIIDELEADIQKRLEDGQLLVMAPYREMGDEIIAVTAWGRRDKFPVSEYNQERVDTFIDAMKCRFNPEVMVGAGC
jgi:hypothetical protein